MTDNGARMREARGAGGARIVYRVAGPPAARPLLLVHGWAQSGRCWDAAVTAGLADSHRLIAVDLRGHGDSDAPAAGYDDPAAWAGDLRAVLAAESIGPGAGAVLVGWSYGGLVCADLLASDPDPVADGTVAALVLVGAITALGRGRAGGRVGPAMRAALPAALSADPAEAVPALTGFIDSFHADGAQAQALLGTALATPPRVRAALFARETDHDELLAALSIPALIVHAGDDEVVDPSAGAHAAALIPGAHRPDWPTGGHAPFIADPDRFVAALTGFLADLPVREAHRG